MFKSIRKRLILNFVIMAILILISNSIFMSYRAAAGIKKQMEHDGLTIANFIKGTIARNKIEDLDKVQELLVDMKREAEGSLYYIGIIDKDEVLIAGSETDYIGQKIDSKGIKETLQGETQSFMNQWKGKAAFNVMVPAEYDGQVVACVSVGLSIDNLTDTVKKTVGEAVFGGVVILLLSAAVGIFQGARIARPIERLKKTVEKIGSGDLTVKGQVKGNDEVSQLTKANNETIENIREVIRKVKSVSNGLGTLSEQLSAGGEQVYESSESIAAAITTVSDEGTKQTMDLEEAVLLLHRFSEDLNGVNDSLVELAKDGEIIKEHASLGSERIVQLKNGIKDIKKSFNNVENKVQGLDSTISEINSIVDVINSVASQTNLLALNASIEAARAGDAGRGFSVVAEEIRKLAEEVLSSSHSITQLVNKVMKETSDTTETTVSAAKIAEKNEEDIEASIKIFHEIINKVNRIPHEINSVYEILQTTVEGREKIQSTVERISSNSEEITSLSEEVTAASQEQTVVTEEMAKFSRKLSKMSKALESSIKEYRV